MDCGQGEQLLAIGTAIAVQVSQSACLEDLEVLASLFNVIGEQLGLLAASRARRESASVYPPVSVP